VKLRKLAALFLVALWVGVLGWQARRLYLRPEAEKVASAARFIPPGVAYYRVTRAGRQVGWAESSVDTLPAGAGFRLTDRVVIELAELGAGLGDVGAAGPEGGGSGTVAPRDTSRGAPGSTVEIRSEATTGPTLALRSFRATSSGFLGGLSATGRMVGDSLLLLQAADSAGRPHGPVDTVRTHGPIVFENAVPLRVAAEERVSERDSLRVRVFDPLQMAPRTQTLRIVERATRTYPDSADQDSVTGLWRAARLDTVRAWKVARETGGVTVTSWVDEDGRILRAALGGVELERTAFELAYYPFLASGSPGGRP